MPVTVDIRDAARSVGAFDAVFAEPVRIDRLFSPFIADSAVSRINAGALLEADAGPLVAEVLARCPTAAFAMGLAGLAFSAAQPGYEAYAIEPTLRASWTPGFLAFCAPRGGPRRRPLTAGRRGTVVAGAMRAVYSSVAQCRGAHHAGPLVGTEAEPGRDLRWLGRITGSSRRGEHALPNDRDHLQRRRPKQASRPRDGSASSCHRRSGDRRDGAGGARDRVR